MWKGKIGRPTVFQIIWLEYFQKCAVINWEQSWGDGASLARATLVHLYTHDAFKK